jgi:hypothetical protein
VEDEWSARGAFIKCARQTTAKKNRIQSIAIPLYGFHNAARHIPQISTSRLAVPNTHIPLTNVPASPNVPLHAAVGRTRMRSAAPPLPPLETGERSDSDCGCDDGHGDAAAGPACSRVLMRSSGFPTMMPTAPLRYPAQKSADIGGGFLGGWRCNMYFRGRLYCRAGWCRGAMSGTDRGALVGRGVWDGWVGGGASSLVGLKVGTERANFLRTRTGEVEVEVTRFGPFGGIRCDVGRIWIPG